MSGVVNNGKVADWASSTSTTGGTSGTFNTTNGDWYVIAVTADSNEAGSAATLSLSFATGGNAETFHTALFYQENVFSPAQLVAYFQATASVSGTSIALTASNIVGFEATVSDCTGIDSTNPVGATVQDTTTSHLGPTITPNRSQGLVFASYGDRNESITLTGNAATTILSTVNPLGAGGETFYTAVTSSGTTAGTPVTVGLASGTATGAVSIGVEFQAALSTSGPNYAGAAAAGGGGSGSWTNTANATGAPDAADAVWTAP